MPALDTHVLARFIVRDDEVQLAAAWRLIGGAPWLTCP
jgi:predicted nucleic-acid-binding protein